jgi:hypothetical protein
LKAIKRQILEQSARAVVHPTSANDSASNPVNQETFSGELLMDEFPMNLEMNGRWDNGDLEWNPDITSNSEKDFDLRLFGDQ